MHQVHPKCLHTLTRLHFIMIQRITIEIFAATKTSRITCIVIHLLFPSLLYRSAARASLVTNSEMLVICDTQDKLIKETHFLTPLNHTVNCLYHLLQY
jgi:hypothetical protein